LRFFSPARAAFAFEAAFFAPLLAGFGGILTSWETGNLTAGRKDFLPFICPASVVERLVVT